MPGSDLKSLDMESLRLFLVAVFARNLVEI